MEEKDLTKMTVTKLREEAKKYTSIQGVSAMKKEELIKAIADARGEPIEIKKKHRKKKKKAVTIADIKKEISKLREEKENARQAKDKKKVERLRKKIKSLKRQTRQYAKDKVEEAATAAKEAAKGKEAPAEKKSDKPITETPEGQKTEENSGEASPAAKEEEEKT